MDTDTDHLPIYMGSSFFDARGIAYCRWIRDRVHQLLSPFGYVISPLIQVTMNILELRIEYTTYPGRLDSKRMFRVQAFSGRELGHRSMDTKELEYYAKRVCDTTYHEMLKLIADSVPVPTLPKEFGG